MNTALQTFLLAAAALPLLGTSATADNARSFIEPLPLLVQSTASVQAVDTLTDAECVAIQEYLLRASRAALLAYADGLREATQTCLREAREAGESEEDYLLIPDDYEDHAARITAAMQQQSMAGVPEDIRQYLMRAAAMRSQANWNHYLCQANPNEDERALMQQYPRAAACLSPIGGDCDVVSIFQPLRCAMFKVEERLEEQQADALPETERVALMLRELQQAAADMPQSIEAAEARLALMRQAMAPYNRFCDSTCGVLRLDCQDSIVVAAAPASGYAWQLAEPLPDDAPLSLQWSDVRRTDFRKDDFLYGYIYGNSARRATLTPQHEGRLTLRFIFTRPEDAEPLFSRSVDIDVLPALSDHEKVEALLRAKQCVRSGRIFFASWDEAQKLARAASLTPRQALQRLESALAEQSDKPEDIYPQYRQSRHLCLIIGDYYFFSKCIAHKFAGHGRVEGCFVSMKDGRVIPYTGEAYPFDVPYGHHQSLLLLEIGENIRPIEAAIERYNRELPPGAPRFDPATHLLDVITVRNPDEPMWDGSDSDDYNYYSIYLEGPMKSKWEDSGRYHCVVERSSGRIISFTRTR